MPNIFRKSHILFILLCLGFQADICAHYEHLETLLQPIKTAKNVKERKALLKSLEKSETISKEERRIVRELISYFEIKNKIKELQRFLENPWNEDSNLQKLYEATLFVLDIPYLYKLLSKPKAVIVDPEQYHDLSWHFSLMLILNAGLLKKLITYIACYYKKANQTFYLSEQSLILNDLLSCFDEIK